MKRIWVLVLIFGVPSFAQTPQSIKSTEIKLDSSSGQELSPFSWIASGQTHRKHGTFSAEEIRAVTQVHKDCLKKSLEEFESVVVRSDRMRGTLYGIGIRKVSVFLRNLNGELKLGRRASSSSDDHSIYPPEGYDVGAKYVGDTLQLYAYTDDAGQCVTGVEGLSRSAALRNYFKKQYEARHAYVLSDTLSVEAQNTVDRALARDIERSRPVQRGNSIRTAGHE